MEDNRPLFDIEDLRKLDFDDTEGVKFNPLITQNDPGENLLVRPLQRGDFNHGYYKLLAQLTQPGDTTIQSFHAQFDDMYSCKGMYYSIVVEDTNTKEIIASCTLLIEKKFIRGCTSRGRIEDVVVDTEYRGKQLGKLLILIAKKLARNVGCYKLTLECEKEKVPFYEKFGLDNNQTWYMEHRF